MKKILKQDFFNRPVLEVAPDLLGKFLARKISRQEIVLMITDVEAYDGFKDKASHASKGRTERNKVMFGVPGRWYVYFVYGTHWMLNAVTGPEDYPAAVLIRGTKEINGPGRLTKFLKIDKKFNGLAASKKDDLWMEDRGLAVKPKMIKRCHRVGVDYAGPYWSRRKWRFLLE